MRAVRTAAPGGLDICGPPVLDIGRGMQAEPAVAVLVVVPAEEVLAVRPGSFDGDEAAGEAGPVFQGLGLGLGVRIALLTCGQEWDWVTPRSASSSATGVDVIEEPRPAWIVSWPRW
jgi:hypothetical protein